MRLPAHRHSVGLLAVTAILSTGFTAVPSAVTTAGTTADTTAVAAATARDAEPVVVTGDRFADWSRLAATGQPATFPAGGNDDNPFGDEVRSAHHGTIVIPPDVRVGVPVDEIVGYRYDDGVWTAVPVQVDERFPHFLSNGRSDFGFYSGVDTELTYAWTSSASTVGEESWKKIAGECEARYVNDVAEAAALQAAGTLTPGQGETLADYLGAKADPVPGLDDDDEIAFLASDAGQIAPIDAAAPAGTTAGSRHQVLLQDPTNPTSTSAVYLFRSATPQPFDASNGYVDWQRADDADTYVDRNNWAANDPEKLGTSNTGYGPNLPGTVCSTDAATGVTTVRSSTDRFVSDATIVSTAGYRWTASGRWMIRAMQILDEAATEAASTVVTTTDGTGKGNGFGHTKDRDGKTPEGHTDDKPGVRNGHLKHHGVEGEGEVEYRPVYGPDLIDRWKGRAFQQSPDSAVSLVGFEDEQVNWEANSALVGWRVGPVRAIRETWGADSGTNVTKVETFYRDLITYRFRVRVHPIPADGLYTSWDYNDGVATTYFNELQPDGVAIDGVNDDVGQVDGFGGYPAYFDFPDPTFDLPSALYRWEQVAGAGSAGSLVYSFDLSGATTATNPIVVPYYRDDACLDDGTGDDPVARPWPGETSTDARVMRGYAELAGKNYDAGERADCTLHETQGAFGAHGLHFLTTHDSDNLFFGSPTPLTEIDGTQWQFAVPQTQPTNVGSSYGDVVRARSIVAVTPQP